jgi:hypothetical protein
MQQKPRLYSPDEAGRLIPEFARLLPELRSIRDQVIRVQNLCDIEELTSFGSTGALADDARRKMDDFHARIASCERDFERKLRSFEEAGCELKSLEPGLVDFYWERGGELVYLCWQEGEESIGFWHPLSGGFAGRQPLP